jgi:hypothetical protein
MRYMELNGQIHAPVVFTPEKQEVLKESQSQSHIRPTTSRSVRLGFEPHRPFSLLPTTRTALKAPRPTVLLLLSEY